MCVCVCVCVCVHNGILLSPKKRNVVICGGIDGPRNHHTSEVRQSKTNII